MNPTLVAIAGSLTGTTFALTGEEVSIGREPSNQLCLHHRSVSRRHCRIQRKDAEYVIRDLGSRNGTFVNDVPVNERSLQHGDQIQVGDSVLRFLLLEDIVSTASVPVQPEGDDSFTVSLPRLPTGESVYLQSERLVQTLVPLSRMACDLTALLKIVTVITSIQEPKALQQLLLELIFDVVPADEGSLLLTVDGAEQFTSVSGWRGAHGPTQQVHANRTIVQQVIRDGNPVLSNNVLEDESSQGRESVRPSEVRSVLCLPLQLFKKTLGVIYLSSSNPSARFDEDHLQLVTAIAAIASVALENARQMEWLRMENQRLQTVINLKDKMVGESAPMRQVFQLIARVASTTSTVLLLGESGVGKELVARAIHCNSPRVARSFMAVNCAAIPESLLESTLFGYEKDAFTGATKRREGILKEADGGTVFLDEVTEMSLSLQAKLLRVLQEREFKLVGGKESISVDVRWVAATNKDLRQAMKNGTFREDLFYRLNVVPLQIPPLRERQEDISLLATHFAAKYGKECGRPLMGISSEARQLLNQYHWPGNVRELQNAIERAVVLGSGDLIRPEDLPETLVERGAGLGMATSNFEMAKKQCRKQIVLHYLDRAEGKQSEAAKLLGILPQNLRRMIRDEKIDIKERRVCPLYSAGR